MHRWTTGDRCRGARLGAAADAGPLRIDRRVLRRGPRSPRRPTSGPAIDSFSTRAMALDLRAAYGRVPTRPGVGYFFPRPSSGQRVQAAEPVPAVDGPARRARSGRLVTRAGGQARRAARHAHHPGRAAVSASRATRARGGRWRRTSRPRSAGSTPRIPVKYDFSMCHLGMMDACGFERAEARLAVSAQGRLPATRAYTAAVSATIRSTVKRFAPRGRGPPRPSAACAARSCSSRDDRVGHALADRGAVRAGR